MLKKINKLSHFALLISIINVVFYHLPFFKFVCNNTAIKSLNGILLLVSLIVLAVLLNALLFYIVLYLLRSVGKWLIAFLFIVNAIAVYFINTYGIIIDETMIGNILNTKFEESSSFFSFTLVAYIIFLGMIPCIMIFKIKTVKETFKRFLVHVSLTLIFLLSLAYINSTNWLWIDKNSKTLGGLAMPWSYVVNLNLFYVHKSHQNQEQILLPNATIKDTKKSVMVLVIGESARSENFSLYGYKKDTNPLLSKINNVHSYIAESSATYTTAGVKSILEYKDTSKLYEILPNYLFRNNVEVIWRTTNWGEPTVKIKNYQKKEDLKNFAKKANVNMMRFYLVA